MSEEVPVADELTTVFARMSGLLLSRETVQGALELVTALAAETIPGSVGSGVSLLDAEGRRTTAAATGPLVERADAAQYDAGEGPCLYAWAGRVVVRVDDTSTDDRWPAWAKVAASLGLRSALSVPLVAGDEPLGAMKVYAEAPGAYDERAERRLTLFAGQAAVLLANMVSHEAARRLSDQLKDALRSRDLIGQAKGVLMARENLDEAAAFTMLVAISQREQAPAARRGSGRAELRRPPATLSGPGLLPAAADDDQRRSLAALAARLGLDAAQLWLDYFALGGEAGEFEVDAYLSGLMLLPAQQRDLLTHAANERLYAAGPLDPAPYSHTIRDPLPDRGLLAAMICLLDGVHEAPPGSLPAVAASAGELLGVGLTMYLADYQQRELMPLPHGDQPVGEPLAIDATLAGRAYRQLDPVASTADGPRLWLPLLDGTERLGVLEVTVSDPAELTDPLLRKQCGWVGRLLGHLVTILGGYGDALDAARRRAPRSTAAELVWSLLPPLTAATATCTVAGMLEPSYAVGGDTFDYALSDTTATVSIFDAMGHGLSAGLLSAAALGASRAARRNGATLLEGATAVDEAVAGQAGGEGFVTGVLMELDLATGGLRYLAAGHPAPLLLRAGRMAGPLSVGRRLPFGLGGEQTIAETRLQPGDWLVLHSDGITEARDATGAFFGSDRLAVFLEREAASGQPVPETLRRLIHAVLTHQGGLLQDDATIVLTQWHPNARAS